MLDAAAVQQLTGGLRPRLFLPKEEVCGCEAPPDSVLLLRTGTADIHHASSEAVLGCVHEGGAVGAAECLLQRTPGWLCYAFTLCDMLALLHTDLEAVRPASPAAARPPSQRPHRISTHLASTSARSRQVLVASGEMAQRLRRAAEAELARTTRVHASILANLERGKLQLPALHRGAGARPRPTPTPLAPTLAPIRYPGKLQHLAWRGELADVYVAQEAPARHATPRLDQRGSRYSAGLAGRRA